MVPIENGVEDLLASHFDVAGLLSVLDNLFVVHVLDLFCLSVEVELHFFILNIRMINSPKILPFGHSSLFGKKVQFSCFFFFSNLKIRFPLFIVFNHITLLLFVFRINVFLLANFLHSIEKEFFEFILLLLFSHFGSNHRCLSLSHHNLFKGNTFLIVVLRQL